MIKKIWAAGAFVFFQIGFMVASVSVSADSPTYERYFKDTYQSLELKRDANSGLLPDSFTDQLVTLNGDTSPTNIGLDLLLQLEASKMSRFHSQADRHLRTILQTLAMLPYHDTDGLFFNRYSSSELNVVDPYISSIDNFHLAFALWAVHELEPSTIEGLLSDQLFKRMNFRSLYDSKTGIIAGGKFFRNGKWENELWKFDYFGSEGRSLYSIGWAIGLIQDQDFAEKSLASITIEMSGSLLKLWDGGAFQLLLPRLLMNEEVYSHKLNDSFLAYARFVLVQGAAIGLSVPASFSACQVGPTEYNGKAGSPELVSPLNQDFKNSDLRQHWDEVFTPHAALLAAPLMPAEFEKALVDAENLGTNGKLYVSGLGWLDGLHVKGSEKGQVVPVFLTLDQEMIALASAQLISKSNKISASEALFRNPKAHFRLTEYFKLLDQN